MHIFYNEKMFADADSFSKSPLKPRLFVEQAKEIPGVVISDFEPVTFEQLCLAHDPKYVNGVISLAEENGFGTRSLSVAKSLPYTSGSMLAAARHALVNKIACSPTSGFHHAYYASAGGFCTFNGLMVTALVLHEERGLRVGILDFDQHYGDGTDDIRWVVHGKKVVNYTTGNDRRCYKGGWSAYKKKYLLPAILPAMAYSTDLVLYQAGADCHVDDPLGGWLTTEEMKDRDETILEFCYRVGLPVAWNLAGGYQNDFQKVIDLHLTTLKVAINCTEQQVCGII